ncbi:MAG: hypothetical protein GXO20_02965 [Thermodesulfobacteria bacterium]|nr:hypothetical protein [Thermodesulfobacteriota bacterium]
MRCPKCKYIVAEYFQVCPECQEDLSELSRYFGPFYEPDPEFLESLWEESEVSESPEGILFDKLEQPEDDLFPPLEEETITVAEAPDLEELEEEFPLAEVDEEEFEAIEEFPEIELKPEDLEGSIQETLVEKEETDTLDLFEDIESLEEILPEEIKEK